MNCAWNAAAAALLLSACATEPRTALPGAPEHHVEGGFRNAPATPRTDAVAFGFDRLRLAIAPRFDAVPRPPPRGSRDVRAAWEALGGDDAVLWIGHATVLIRLGGKTILFDPVFGDYATPLPPLGPRRLVPPALALEELPRIDAILVSHDHYDHFEPAAIRRIAARDRPVCLLPLGVGGHADFGCARTERLDWGGRVRLGGVTLHFLPAQHDSGRGIADRNRALWGAWLVEARRGGESRAREGAAVRRVFFAGDTGYGPHFARIGAAHGPIALALLPVAAYRPRVVNRHMHLDPEGAMKAFADLGAQRLVAIHWGTFALGTDDAFAARADMPRAAAAAGIARDRVWLLEIGEVRRF